MGKLLKILQIIPTLSKGGAERLLLDLVTELKNRNGIDSKIVTFYPINEYIVTFPDIKPIVIEARVTPSFINKWKFKITELQSYINEFKPDIIHTHLFEAEFVSRTVFYPQAKWFSHCHDNMVQFERLRINKLFSKKKISYLYEKKYLFNRYRVNNQNSFITVSDNTYKYFKERTPKNMPIYLLKNAININRFNVQNKKVFNKDKLKLINIGSFVPKKNQIFLIDVAKELFIKKVDFELHFLGDGEMKNIVQRKAQRYNLSDRIIFHGNTDFVESHLSNADIYIHSAKYEPFGIVILEAMASGLPVIALDGRGNRDIIRDGENGIMIWEPDTILFADAIIKVWNDKDLYNRLSSCAQEYVKTYDIQSYTDKLLEIYNI
ncbi:TPA: glycosyltransferase [bacterium]|nr:glycosyltransferase [bacterium]